MQNIDDRDVLCREALASPEQIRLIRGSGVDPTKFNPRPPPPGPPLVILPARLLRDKGVLEFAEAARRLKAEGWNARFALVGAPDPGNTASVSQQELTRIAAEGVVELWGWRDDMAEVIRQSSIVCLPSTYGEGLPKSLLEAAAGARPIITTDMPGCREIVRPGENGWLVPPRSVDALTIAMSEALSCKELREQYGARGRQFVEAEFSLQSVNRQTLDLYLELLAA